MCVLKNSHPNLLKLLQTFYPVKFTASFVEIKREGIMLDMVLKKRSEYALYTLDAAQKLSKDTSEKLLLLPLQHLPMFHYLHKKHEKLLIEAEKEIARQVKLLE